MFYAHSYPAVALAIYPVTGVTPLVIYHGVALAIYSGRALAIYPGCRPSALLGQNRLIV